jgi:hypothetical protein
MDWGLDGTRIGENFIGWTAAQRQARLYLILNNRASRFRPGCASQPASRVLAVATRRLTEDWHQRYGYQPVLLERFVESPRIERTIRALITR